MDFYQFLLLFSLLPLAAALFKIKKIIAKEYRGILGLLFVEVLAFIIAPWVIKSYFEDSDTLSYLTSNSYTVVILFFSLFFFFNIGLFNKKYIIALVMAIAIILMIIGAISFGSINILFFYGSLFTYTVIIFFSVNLLSKRASNYRVVLFKDSYFLIASANIIRFTYQAFILILLLFPAAGLNNQDIFFNLFYTICAASYLIYFYAILCI